MNFFGLAPQGPKMVVVGNSMTFSAEGLNVGPLQQERGEGCQRHPQNWGGWLMDSLGWAGGEEFRAGNLEEVGLLLNYDRN